MDEVNTYNAYDEPPSLRGEDDSLLAEDEPEDIEFSDDESEGDGTNSGLSYITSLSAQGDAGTTPGTPIMPEADGLIYHEMKARLVPGAGDLALEEFDRRAAGFYGGKTTYYMSAEEREAYRLSVNEQGQLVDADGNLYSSGENTQGHYPGSTGGDLFVMDQGGVFAADLVELQNELNQDSSIGPGRGKVVHHSTLAAGQREVDEDGIVDRSKRLRVAASGELRVELRDEERWEQDEHGRLVKDEDGNYVPAEPVKVQDVRSISDASGHFLPEEDQTLQFVETLQDAGVNLDNTKINLVDKPVFDMEGDLRGVARAIDVYSGEFIASEGDQLALNQKRSVMDQIAGRAMGPQTEHDSEILDNLARRREALDAMAEARARRFEKDDDSSAPSSDADESAGASYTIDPQTGERVFGSQDGGQGADEFYTIDPQTGERVFAAQENTAPFGNPNAYSPRRGEEEPSEGEESDAPFGNPNAYAASRDQGTVYDEAPERESSEDAPLGNPNAYGTARDVEESLEDAPFGNPNAYSATREEDSVEDSPFGNPNAYSANRGEVDSLEDEGPEGDSAAEEAPEDAAASGTPWQGAAPQGGRRAGPTIGQQRGQAWQDAAPQGGRRAGPTIGSRRGGQ